MCLRDQLIKGLNANGMMMEIICELTSEVNASSVTSEQVLACVRRIEPHRTHTTMLKSFKEKEIF